MLSKGSTATCFWAPGRNLARMRFLVEGMMRRVVKARIASTRIPPTHRIQGRGGVGAGAHEGREASSNARRDVSEGLAERDALREVVVASSPRDGSTASRSRMRSVQCSYRFAGSFDRAV